MTQRILNSKGVLAYLAAAATWLALYLKGPFPEENLFLRLIAMRTPVVFQGLKCSYLLFLFTTPYIVYSIFLSGVYVFALRVRRRISPGRLPAYPDPRRRNELFLVVGEVHNPRKPLPSENPKWLVIPERGLLTGIAIVGAVGTGKTSCCMYPFAEQLLAYQADDQQRRIGGLILEVKGDFCRKVRQILKRHSREDDYVGLVGSTTRHSNAWRERERYLVSRLCIGGISGQLGSPAALLPFINIDKCLRCGGRRFLLACLENNQGVILPMQST